MGQQIVRFKWNQIDDGGIIKIIIWDNSQDGLPGNILDSKTVNGFNAVSGWNEYDLSEENWSVSGDFWIGIKAYSIPSIAIDYDVGSNSSMYRNSDSNWSTIDNWNVGLRVFLNCEGENFDECGICNGDNSSCLDCAGEINGDAQIDECGVCGGDNFYPDGCSCIIGPLDDCGICGGPGESNDCGCEDINDGECDCLGTLPDECGVCFGNNVSQDDCGTCGGNNSTCTGCMDSDYEEYDEDAMIPCEDCCSSIILVIDENIIPSKFEIINLYPNPFNPSINIEYNLPTTSNVKVSIYNVKGQEVEKLVDSIQHTGFHSLTWITTETNSGIYFVQITADTDIINRKIMYLK